MAPHAPGAAGTPAWFVSVLRLVTAGLDNILMYLDDAIGPDDCPLHYVATLATFFARLHLHKLKLSPDKSRIMAPHAPGAAGTPAWFVSVLRLVTVFGSRHLGRWRSPQ